MDPVSPAPYSLDALVVAAFHMARDRGKTEWHRMTIAVLKNRLLQLSHGQFAERNHGGGTFRELLARHPALVRLDGDHVELRLHEATSDASTTAGGRPRVQPDLWQAVMDYSSGKTYAWDEATKRAREALPGDALVLPTIAQDELAAWRADFARAHPSSPGLEQWKTSTYGTAALPARLRGPWNGFVRERVADRLAAWFREKGIEASIFATVDAIPEVERLRAVVAACVAVMTAEELGEIRLTPAAVLRARLPERIR